MSPLNRRELLQRAACMAAATAVAWRESNAAEVREKSARMDGQPGRLETRDTTARGQRPVPKLRDSGAPLPKTVAGIRLPDTKLAESAVELATASYPPHLLNHALRTFVFGALAGRAQKLQFDDEPLYIACLLHDLGLTPKYEGDLPFEIQGAEAALTFLKEHGVTGEKADMVWDGIAMHASIIGAYKRPEIMLVGHGAGADVLGPDPEDIPAEKVAEVVAAFPRLKFKEQFVKSCAGVITRHPGGATRSFMRDIGERYVPNFKPRNFCDLMEKAPFDE
jgi:hypothetical protein